MSAMPAMGTRIDPAGVIALDGLRLTLRRSLAETVSLPASDVLAVPLTVEPWFDGDFGWRAFQESPSIWFGFGCIASLAGRGYEDMCALAAVLAAHLASADASWPSGEARVRAMPVVEFRFDFIATPAPLPDDDAWQRATDLARLLAQGAGSGAGVSVPGGEGS